MADEEDLKEKIKEVIKGKDAGAAVELLTGDNAYDIPKNDRNRLADIAIKDAFVAPHFSKIFGLLSGDVLKRLCVDLGTHGKPNMVFEALEDPEYQKHRETITTAAISNANIGIVQLYPFAIRSASAETKEALNAALGRNVGVTNEELASIIGDGEFQAHRSSILRHVEARMDAEALEVFLSDIRSVLPDEEIVRLEQTIARKKKYHADDNHAPAHHEGEADRSNYWAIGLVILLILILSG